MDKTRRLDEFYTQRQALQCLSLPLSHNMVLYRAIKSGKIKDVVKVGRKSLYSRKEIHEMAGHNTPPPDLEPSNLAIKDVMGLNEAIEHTGMSAEWLYWLSNKRGNNPNPEIEYATFCGCGGYFGFFVRDSVEAFVEQRSKSNNDRGGAKPVSEPNL